MIAKAGKEKHFRFAFLLRWSRQNQCDEREFQRISESSLARLQLAAGSPNRVLRRFHPNSLVLEKCSCSPSAGPLPPRAGAGIFLPWIRAPLPSREPVPTILRPAGRLLQCYA